MENQLQQKLPNAVATLILGILSIIGSCCYGIPGLIMAIIALIISANSNKLLKANPEGYSDAGNHKAGRICAFIGLGLGALWFLFLIVYVVILGAAMSDIYNF
jgi:UPF0716 family protein affecting phage T7 exclusion